MLILGIDDVGRGPLIGPMILAGVLIKKEDEAFFKSEGVADSKQLAHPVRVKLAGLIMDTAIDYKVVATSAEQIDHSINSGINLNTLEAIKTAEIINYLAEGKKEKIFVIVDCPSVNTKAWRLTLLNYIKNKDNLEVICEHKADVNHPSVSAASILAKVAREEEVAKIKEKYEKYGNIGSGYPSDPFTQQFLKKRGKELANSGLFRKTWATWKALFPDKKQMTLGEF
ncbi:MAG: ribonuclease HII [Nanoarchaeota archaeon]